MTVRFDDVNNFFGPYDSLFVEIASGNDGSEQFFELQFTQGATPLT